MRSFIAIIIILMGGLNLSFHSMLHAQEAQFRIISCQGDIKVRLADNREVKIYPGDKLEPKGTLMVGSNGYIKLICKDTPHTFNAAGEHKLSELYASSIQQSMSSGRILLKGLPKAQ